MDREVTIPLKDAKIPVNLAESIRQKNRKTITSETTGTTYVIRRLHQRDFMPKGMIAMIVKEDLKSVEEIEKYTEDNLKEIEETERLVLSTGVVDPMISFDPDDSNPKKLYVLDMGPDKDWVIGKIAEFSGFSQDVLDLVDKFRREALAHPGNDEQVLRSVAARVLGHENTGREAGVPVLEELPEGAGEAGAGSRSEG